MRQRRPALVLLCNSLRATGSAPRLLAAALGLAAACAPPYEFPPVNFGATPQAVAFPDTSAVVIDDIATLSFTFTEELPPRPYAVLTHYRRVKILREEGLRYATLQISSDASSAIGQVAARTVLPDGQMFMLDLNTMQQTAVSPLSTEMQVRSFTIPNAAVGAVIDYWYEVLIRDVRAIPPWVFGDDLPVQRAEFSLVLPPGMDIDVRTGMGTQLSDLPPQRRELPNGMIRLLWVLSELPPVYPEENMPMLQRLRPWIAPVVRMIRAGGGEFPGFTQWNDVTDWFSRMTKPAGDVHANLGIEAKTQEPPQIYRWVQEHCRPIATDYLWSLAAVPSAAIATMHPAAARDVAVLLAALLREHNEPASVVLVAPPSGRVVIPDAPSPSPFSHALVAIERQGGGYLMLDPSCRFCAYGEYPTEFQGGTGLLLGQQATTTWLTLPVGKPEDNRTRLQVSLTMNARGELAGLFTLELTGEPAQALRGLLSDKSTGWEGIVTAFVTEPGASLQVSNLEVANLPQIELPLKVQGSCTVKMKDIRYQHYEFAAERVSGGIMTALWRTSRRYPLLTRGPFVRELLVSIKLPPGYVVDAPLPVSINSAFGSVTGSYRGEGGIFAMSRQLKLTTPVIPAERYAEFLAFIDKARRSEAMSIIFQSSEE